MNATDLRADIQRLQLQNLREASAKIIPAPSREPLEFSLRARDAVLAFLCAPLPCTGCRAPMRHDPTRNIVAWSGLPPYATRDLFHQNCWYNGITR
jgi:hypothetical protein